MWCIGTYVLSYLPSLLPFMQGWIAKDAAVTQSSPAPAAFGGCLCDAHQHPSCRPTNPANGNTTINRLNWPYSSLQAHWGSLTRIHFLLKSNRRLAAAPSPATGPGYPQPPRASIQAQSHPGPGGWPPAAITWHPPAPRPTGDPFSRAQSGLA
jgi:hypothetical protein